MKNKELIKRIKSIIQRYEMVIKEVDEKTRSSEKRAYGGIVRSTKRKLVEDIARDLVKIAWEELDKDPSRLSFSNNIIKIPINNEYINKIKNPDVRNFIETHLEDFYYPLKTDIHVFVDNKFKVAIECKTYTENAMLKRILVDFTLLKQLYPHLTFILFQLESQLGGDYSLQSSIQYGSPSTHTLLSYFDIDLHSITLLKGERQIDRPIHKTEYYKPLQEDSLIRIIDIFKTFLKKF